MTAYYNEHDGFKAEWLRELIRGGHIAKGEVDERDIREVQASDLAGFAQCHFFAGIGVWSYALRLAGWPDDRSVWTGSCPCPGFSAAGKGGGFSDPRHLWPDWFRLARERRPANLFGEQADDAVGFGWLDLVQTDLEAADYAVGKAVFGACSVGAPHIRQRLYFGAHAHGAELFREPSAGNKSPDRRDGKAIQRSAVTSSNGCGARRSSEPGHESWQALAEYGNGIDGRTDSANGNGRSGERPKETGIGENRFGRRGFAGRGAPDGHADSGAQGLPLREPENLPGARRREEGRAASEPSQIDGFGCDADSASSARFGQHSGASEVQEGVREGFSGASWTNGFWRDAIWLPCRDGKYRPTQPGLFPLAHGAPARVGRLRGYGGAIVAQQAQAFIEAFIGAVQP